MKKFVYSIIGFNKISSFDQYFGNVCLLHYSSAFVCAIIGIVCLRDYVCNKCFLYSLSNYTVLHEFKFFSFAQKWVVIQQTKNTFFGKLEKKMIMQTNIFKLSLIQGSKFVSIYISVEVF